MVVQNQTPGFDPQLKSLITSVLLAICTAAAGIAVSHGIIPGADQAALANQLSALLLGLISAGLAWYKARQVSPTALIKAVNEGDNGVKVVSENTVAATIKQPLKGSK